MDSWLEIFRPERTKSVLALVLTVAHVAAIFYVPVLGWGEVLKTLPSDQLTVVLVVNLALNAIAYYLFLCGLFGLRAVRRRPRPSRYLALALLLVLVFNPATLYLLSLSLHPGGTAPSGNSQVASCGQVVVSFADFSKAQQAGLRAGDVVTKLDGEPVRSAGDVQAYLKRKRPGDVVRVQTDRGVFPVELVNEPEQGGPVLGVKLSDAACPAGSPVAPVPAPSAVVYVNSAYGFEFTLPASWQGYTLVEETWEGYHQGESGQLPAARGPLLLIRHPRWTAESPRQDIPILVFTLAQWDEIQHDLLHIGAAPFNPEELGRNGTYVFALPARYNYAFPAGYEEVEQILQGSPLRAF